MKMESTFVIVIMHNTYFIPSRSKALISCEKKV